MKKLIPFIIEKALAVGLIVFGGYVVVCHFGKIVPFGIKLPDPLMAIWAYAGWLIGIIIVAAGIYLLLREYWLVLEECITEDKENLQ